MATLSTILSLGCGSIGFPASRTDPPEDWKQQYKHVDETDQQQKYGIHVKYLYMYGRCSEGKYVPHPPAYRRLPPKIHSTLGQLIEILEQLSSKEELSSVLRRIVAECDDTSSANGQSSSRVDLDPETIIKVAQILYPETIIKVAKIVCKLNPNYTSMSTTTITEHDGTKTGVSSALTLDEVSKESPGKGQVRPWVGERAQRTIDCKNLSLSKQDSLYLVKKIRDFEQKCKPLQEKNKKFLERNMELTTLNRNLKEQIRNIMEENKKLKDNVEQNKRKCGSLSQQLNKEKTEREQMSTQVKQLDELRAQVVEQCKTISQLKQATQEKDRRMEVLQQRKKRRLRMSAEHLSRLSSPCSGYEDDRSIDSDLSVSSISGGTLSDDEAIEELPHDEVDKTEKKFKLLMKEHIALQKSMTKLQGIIGKSDPERFLKLRTTFETDMYIAQCKIDSLEESLEKYKESDLSWVREKDDLSLEIDNLTTQNKTLTERLKVMTESVREITQAYEESQEQKEELEFLILETQSVNNTTERPESCDVSTETDPTLQHGPTTQHQDFVHINHLEYQSDMSEEQRQAYQATIKTLEDKLTHLLQGQGSEVMVVMEQLKQAEMHVGEVESTMQELQTKVVCLQEEKASLTSKLEKCREKLDAQEQSLTLTRDEREELLQVKPRSAGLQLNSRLRLAEVGHDSIRERSLERERPLERIKCSSPLSSPRITRTLSETSIDSLSTIAHDRPGEDETVLTVSNFDTLKQCGFDKDNFNVTGNDLHESMLFEEQTPKRPRINSVPALSSTMTVHYEFTHEVDRLQKQITDLRDENDVLRYEMSQKCTGDGYGSGSDSEDPRNVELRETCEKLRERAQTAEALERQYKDRLKLAEKHIGELEVSETVLRDRVEEGNADCDKLRKQIIRLQRKIRELKDVNTEKETSEQTLMEKVKYLEETEAELSRKVAELEGTNHILKQRLDLKDELLGDAAFGDNLKDTLKSLETENAELNAKLIEMEEDNEILRDNWRKVADEEANRRDCLEDKIRVLENTNSELKAKLREQETDLDLSGCQSIASEINDDIIEGLNEKIRELENQLQSVTEEKEKRIEALEEHLDRIKESETRLSETVIEMEHTEKQLKTHIAILEQSGQSSQSVSTVVGYEKKITELKSSQENLLEALDSMENYEDNLKQRLLDMEKSYEKKIDMLEKEIAEYQQQEEDLCTRVEELVENENSMLERIEKYKESEMNLKNKMEEYENRETTLTVSFSQRIEELERIEKQKNEELVKQVTDLKATETLLNEQINKLNTEKEEMVLIVSSLEKHDSESSEKIKANFNEQLNKELQKSVKDQGNVSIELQTKVQSETRIESDTNASLSLPNQTKDDQQLHTSHGQSCSDNQNQDQSDLVGQNQKLNEEISKLKQQIEENEKEKKSLLDQMKRQEKKRKKSQRNDNVDDYDTLAREVVTYKIEVDQLRSENSDLHDRIMELDDSEKNLLEQNENLKSALEKSKDGELSSDREKELQEKISNLESVETDLRQKISSLSETRRDSTSLFELRQPSSDSAYESGKESLNFAKEKADKSIGTDDFMEGVMGSHEQGKPVSSMFQRIQALEADNQDLEQKLSVLTATDAQVRQLSDKVKGLEENEDSLMERVMELEDEEDRLNSELRKLRKQASTIPDLEDQLNQLEEKEKDLNDTKDKLELELDTLKNSMKTSDLATGDIAIRLASVQKMYEDEKKKVETLLKGEEKWMKSVASEKKATKSLEEELSSTQEKLEELQTDYETKLSEKDESMKLLQDEINKLVREREVFKKKLQEFEIANNDLEDEIAACKISESRMFHRHQQLITQNEELENKLQKLAEHVPEVPVTEGKDDIDGQPEQVMDDNTLMSENPDLVSENPLTASIFSEEELGVLRSKTPDTELLGSMPLDMLRKIQDFDERETNYQTKIKELETRNAKSLRKVKILQGREKDFKHEIKELQLELFKHKDSTSSLKLSVSSLDQDKSESDDGLDSGDDLDNDIFKSDDTSLYDDMTQEQLLLSVKLFEEQMKQERLKTERAEQVLGSVRESLQMFGQLLCAEPLDTYLQQVGDFNNFMQSQEHKDESMVTIFSTVLDSVTVVKQNLEALQRSQESLRVTLAEKDIAHEQLKSQTDRQIEDFETQINILSTLSLRQPNNEEIEEPVISQSLQLLEKQISQSEAVSEAETQTNPREQEYYSRDLSRLEVSKIINIDVPPTVNRNSVSSLGRSETIKVNVPPHPPHDDIDYNSDDSSTYYNIPTMMDKAEDVLRQRIRELEKLEKHLKQQVQDLEADREELHEIARKDKNIIHEQNVQLRELQLAQRNLQEQVRHFEESENSLYARLDELENELENKDDKIRHLEILEERLKDLVKQYKLDEKILVTKSATLETSMKEMSAKEETLKEKVQNLESEKNAFCERSEYLQTRLKELENAELDLAQRAKNQDNIVQSLQNTVIELETFGANAQARVVELEQANFDLQQRLHHAMTENSPVTKHASSLQHKCDKMQQELTTLRDSDIRLRQENDSLEKNERTLQDKVKTLQLKEVELETKVRDYNENESVLKDKVAKLQRSENTLKYRVQELENSGIQAPSDLETSLRENNKLPRTLEDCQRRIIMLQANNAELQDRLQQYNNGAMDVQHGPIVSRPQQTVAGSRLSPRNGVITVDPSREPVEEIFTQTTTGNVQTKPPGQKLTRDQMMDDLMMSLNVPSVRTEDAQWREIESRMEQQERGTTEQWINVGKASSLYANNKSTDRSPNSDEVLELHVALLSETESQLNSQNDTDSGRIRNNAKLHNNLQQQQNYQLYSQVPPPPPQFGPPTAGETADFTFVESLHVNRNNQDGIIRNGRHMSSHPGYTPSVTDSLADSGRGTASLSFANFGTNLKERISNIEKQLSTRESDSAREFTGELDLTSWKARVLESNRKLELAEKDNKHYKEEINRLEKELEEKSRQYMMLEAFLYSVETVLTEKSLDDAGIVQKIEKEAENVRVSLVDAGHRLDNIATDPAALNTELSKKDRELTAKRNEVDRLMCELRQWQQECRTIEDMRSNALDSLRGLEVEVTELQEADKQFKQLKDDYNTLKGQFLRLVETCKHLMLVQQQYEDLVNEKDDLDIEITGLRSKVSLLEGQLKVMEGVRIEKKDLEERFLEMKEKLIEKNMVEMEKNTLEKNTGYITELLSERMKKVESLTEEIFELRKKLSSVERDNYRIKQDQLSNKFTSELTDVNKNTIDGNKITIKGDKKIINDIENTIDDSKITNNTEDARNKPNVHEAGNGQQGDDSNHSNNDGFHNNSIEDKRKKTSGPLSRRESHRIILKKGKEISEKSDRVKKKPSSQTSNDNPGVKDVTMETSDLENSDDDLELDGEARRQSPQSTATLRAKIVKLTNMCNEKDLLIRKLVKELKNLQAGDEPSQLLEDLLRLDETSEHVLGRSSSHSSLESGEHVALHLSDTELLHHSSPRHAQRPRSADLYHNKNMPNRQHGGHPRIYANRSNGGSNNHESTWMNQDRNNRRHNWSHSSLNRSSRNSVMHSPRISEGTPFVAIADYDPSVFSQSGHQRLELFLKEGDFVSVMGPADKSGYFEGEVNGVVGLVPASYLQPVPPFRRVGSAHVPGHLNASPERIAQMYNSLRGAHQQNVHGLVPASYLQPVPPFRRVGSAHVPGHLNASPERIAQMYNSLRGAHQQNVHVPYTVVGENGGNKVLREIVKVDKLNLDIPEKNEITSDPKNEGTNPHQSMNGYTNGEGPYPNTVNYVNHVQSSGPPQVPDNFRVEKIIGNSSLMLAWQQLPLDNNSCNSGVKVTGYRIYKNNKILMHPRGARATKAIIENIDIHAHHRFGLQTISADGQVSELSEIMYEGVEEVSDENSDTESEMDMSTVLDHDDFKHGPKRTFMAVYDYDPSKNSPQDHPTSELSFNAGDVITVYGRQRADGFYHGEINGEQGLVPAFFIEEVPQPPPRTKKIASKNKQNSKDQKPEENGQDS